MKYISCLLIFLSSCTYRGHMIFYDFKYSKYEVENEINRVINENQNYVVPVKWKDCNKGDYYERIYVYMKSNPEELYRIGFTEDSTVWKNSSTSRLGLISQFDGDAWRYNDELSKKDVDRITKRFEHEILSKIKYEYYKTD
jgi:hypothetical protein